MTKEQFINKWWPACTTTFIDDLEVVIATEIAKAIEPQSSDKVQISKHTLVEVNRAFRALKQDRNSYIHKVFSDDGVFDAMKEISEAYKYYFGEYPTEQIPSTPVTEQPAPPMTYEERVKHIISNKLTHKKAGSDSWYAYKFYGYNIHFCDENGKDMIWVRFDELDLTEWYPCKKPFDKDRFEAMFCSMVAREPHWTYKDCMIETEKLLTQLDAYYATKEGGNNE